MATTAPLRAHKGALQKLADMVEEKKQDMTDEEYLEVCGLHKTLFDAASALAARSAGTQATGWNAAGMAAVFAGLAASAQTGSANAQADQDSDEEELTRTEQMVFEVNSGERQLTSLLVYVTAMDASEQLKKDALDALAQLVTDADSFGVQGQRQTALGNAGAIEAVAPFVINEDRRYSEWPLQWKSVVLLIALAHRHHANKTRIGEAGIIPAVTNLMLHGCAPMENYAVKLLAEIGFQHAANQVLMREARTAEAIVHLMGQPRTLDRVERSVKLLWNVTCGASGSYDVLVPQAIEAGALPILVRLLGETLIRSGVMETIYKLIDDRKENQATFVTLGGVDKVVAVLKDDEATLDDQAKAARIMGELGSGSPERRKLIADAGCIPVLKELVNEPTGRRRAAFAFALSRVDEEGDGIAAQEVARARQAKEREEKERKAARERQKQRDILNAQVAAQRAKVDALRATLRRSNDLSSSEDEGSSRPRSRATPTKGKRPAKPTKTIAKAAPKRARK